MGGVRSHQADKWYLHPDLTVVEQPLIQDGQQGVQDGTVGLENLINERNIGSRQVPLHLPDVLVVLQFPH